MKISKLAVGALASLFMLASVSTKAAEISLFDWAFNVDGVTYEDSFGDVMPTTGSLDNSGLGTLNIEITSAGSYNIVAFFDFEIDEASNTFFNEYGDTFGMPAVGQSWEIDEPGYLFGDIYDNVLDATLDNFNNVDSFFPDDVSFAIGWDFTLAADQTGSIDFILQNTAPTTGFYLAQTDPDSDATIYFSSILDITSPDFNVQPVPEPMSIALFMLGLLGLNGAARRRV